MDSLKIEFQDDWNEDVKELLFRMGWTLLKEVPGYISELKSPDGLYARIPADSDYADFFDQGLKVLNTLSDATGKSIQELYYEARLTKADVIELRHPSADDLGIPLHVAEASISSFIDSFQVTARQASTRMPLKEGGGKRQQLESLLKSETRFGHTVRGSFVIRIIVQLPAPLHLVDPGHGSFTNLARKSTFAYSNSLRDTDHSLKSGSAPDPLVNSSSFVTKLVALREAASSDSAVEIRTKFSRYGSPDTFAEKGYMAQLRREQVQDLRDISRALVSAADSPRRIVGFVYQLRSYRKPGHSNLVTVRALLSNGKQRSFELDLSEEDYQVAVKAHENCQNVLVTLPTRSQDRKYVPDFFGVSNDSLFDSQ